MKRRDFLKLIGVASMAPSILLAAPKPLKALNYPNYNYQKQLDELVRRMWCDKPVGIVMEGYPIIELVLPECMKLVEVPANECIEIVEVEEGEPK